MKGVGCICMNADTWFDLLGNVKGMSIWGGLMSRYVLAR
jgi:hypothetical protein